jgi:hypothetical protein
MARLPPYQRMLYASSSIVTVETVPSFSSRIPRSVFVQLGDWIIGQRQSIGICLDLDTILACLYYWQLGCRKSNVLVISYRRST